MQLSPRRKGQINDAIRGETHAGSNEDDR
jgi:hypothetical protein